MSNTIALPHSCHCSDYDYRLNPVVALTYQEVDALFGFRNLRGNVAPQTWCRVCRVKGAADSKKKRHNLRLRIFLRSCVSRRNLTVVKTKTALQGGFFEGSLSYQL